jgi:DNA-binding transcriptional LysR family regulator
MVFRQLVYLTALAREGHFRRAAEACGVSQPGLSAALRQLEEELGVPIIDRGQRFKGFTEEGQVVLRWARRILADLDGMQQELTQRTQLSGRIKIGGIPSAMPLLPILTGRLCRKHPAISVEAITLTDSQIVQALADFEIDAGLIAVDSVAGTNLRVVAPLYKERYVFLTPCDGPFAERKSLSWAEAASAPLCLLSRDMQTRHIIDRLFEQAHCAPMAQIETNSILANCAHVCSGYWATIMPEAFLYPFGAPRGTVAVPLVDPAGVQEIGLALVDREPTPPLVRTLLAAADEIDIPTELAIASEVEELVPA